MSVLGLCITSIETPSLASSSALTDVKSRAQHRNSGFSTFTRKNH